MISFVFVFTLTVLSYQGDIWESNLPGKFEMIDSLLIQEDWAYFRMEFNVDSLRWSEKSDTTILTVWTKQLKDHHFEFHFLKISEQFVPVKAVADGTNAGGIKLTFYE